VRACLRSKPRKGLSDIRTMMDVVTGTHEPQRRFLRLAMLAREKVRRGTERDTARQRIEDIDARSANIDAESEILLREAIESTLAAAPAEDRGHAGSPTSPKVASSNPPRPAPARASGRLKLRY